MRHSRILTIRIDAHDISARYDETLLQLARENNIDIPSLCYLDGVSGWGGCRLCMVEIKGSPKLFPACTTYPVEGMEVVTNSERLKRHRLQVLDFMFSERNHICSVCVSNGGCELQEMAARLGMTHVENPSLNPLLPVDASHKLFCLDHNRCILCTRCIRVCDEIEGAHTWDIMGRGIAARLVADLNQPWGEAVSCTSCGKCVQVCPTGALFEKGKAVAEMRKNTEFLPYLRLMRSGRSGDEGGNTP